MRFAIRFFAPVLALLLASCDARPSADQAEAPASQAPAAVVADTAQHTAPAATAQPVDTAVAGAWRQLETALRTRDAAALTQLIDPAVGLWVLEQPGAVPAVTRITNLSSFRRSYQGLPLVSVGAQLMNCPQLRALPALPDAACGLQTEQNAGFALSGCLSGPASSFRQMDLWPYASVKGGTAAQGQAAQRRCTHTVLQTQTGFRFHFAQPATPGGRWHLIFIDLRTPCIA